MEITDRSLEELIAALEQGKSERLLEHLAFQARFHQYSFGNCLLIAIQKPDATYVAGFHRWKELGRFVKKGEKGILILAPLVRRKKSEDQASDEDLEGLAHSSDCIQLYAGDKQLLLSSLSHIQRVASDIIAALTSSSEAAASQAA